MESRQVLFGQEGRDKVKKGIDRVNNATKVTLGAAGRNVLLESPHNRRPHPTKDGVTVAMHIHADDPIENLGVMLMKEVADKTREQAGDGTTSAVLLAHKIVELGMNAIAEGKNPVEIKKGIEEAVKLVVAKIKELSLPCDTLEKLRQISTISANNDSVLGEMIADAVHKIGVHGEIIVENSPNSETSMEVIEGMQVKSGYLNENFVNNLSRMKCELDNPLILVTDKTLSYAAQQVVPAAMVAIQNQRPLVVFCESMNGEALGGLIQNIAHGKIKACVIGLQFVPNMKVIMKDIVTYCGGQVVGDETGTKLDKVKYDPNGNNNSFGEADKVVITKDRCTIIGSYGKPSGLRTLLESLENQVKEAQGKEKEELKTRLASMSSGVGIMKVGANSEPELKEKKDRIDDAVHATKAAMEEGYVAGAGTAFLHSISVIDTLNVGGGVIAQALSEPSKQILQNAGLDVSFSGDYGFGVNAKTGEPCNLIISGIIDPAKVSRVALENAASVAATFLTTEAVVI